MEHVTLMREMRDAYKILASKAGRQRPFGDLGLDGRTLFKWEGLIGFIMLKTGISGRSS
jgi:hypothetical protein